MVKGPALANERLVSLGYTRAELSLPENYAAGNVVGFNRTYKRLSVEKGEELRIGGVDYGNGIVNLAGKDGQNVPWEPVASRRSRAVSRSTGRTRSSFARVTVSAGRGTTRD